MVAQFASPTVQDTSCDSLKLSSENCLDATRTSIFLMILGNAAEVPSNVQEGALTVLVAMLLSPRSAQRPD